jgi:hypothetical protein
MAPRTRTPWLPALVVGLVVGMVCGLVLGAVVWRDPGEEVGEAGIDCLGPAPALEAAELEPSEPSDALQQRTLRELSVFTDWLDRNGAVGFIGEVGWPNDESVERWNELADLWYRAARQAGLGITAWAAGEQWGPYELAVYQSSDDEALDAPTASAIVVEQHRRAPALRGVNANGAEFGIGPNLGVGTGGEFSNRRPGIYDRDWRYPSEGTMRFLACREVDVIRLPFRWERIQPELGDGLDTAELQRLRDTLDRAGHHGIEVIPTVMNYGAYWMDDGAGRGERRPIGSADVTNGDFADLWSRLTTELSDHDSVAAWGLMNEPVDMPGGALEWERTSQAAVDAIRATGDGRPIMVPGYSWSTVDKFPDEHPAGPWIVDPAGRTVYEAHHYFDSRNSGEYEDYDTELARAERS